MTHLRPFSVSFRVLTKAIDGARPGWWLVTDRETFTLRSATSEGAPIVLSTGKRPNIVHYRLHEGVFYRESSWHILRHVESVLKGPFPVVDERPGQRARMVYSNHLNAYKAARLPDGLEAIRDNRAAIVAALRTLFDDLLEVNGVPCLRCTEPVLELRAVHGSRGVKEYCLYAAPFPFESWSPGAGVFFPFRGAAECDGVVEALEASGAKVTSDEIDIADESALFATWTSCFFLTAWPFSQLITRRKELTETVRDPRAAGALIDVRGTLHDMRQQIVESDPERVRLQSLWLDAIAPRIEAENPIAPLEVDAGFAIVEVPYGYDAVVRYKRSSHSNRRAFRDSVDVQVKVLAEDPAPSAKVFREGVETREYAVRDGAVYRRFPGSHPRDALAASSFLRPPAVLIAPTSLTGFGLPHMPGDRGVVETIADESDARSAMVKDLAERTFVTPTGCWMRCDPLVWTLSSLGGTEKPSRLVVADRASEVDWIRAVPISAVGGLAILFKGSGVSAHESRLDKAVIVGEMPFVTPLEILARVRALALGELYAGPVEPEDEADVIAELSAPRGTPVEGLAGFLARWKDLRALRAGSEVSALDIEAILEAFAD